MGLVLDLNFQSGGTRMIHISFENVHKSLKKHKYILVHKCT